MDLNGAKIVVRANQDDILEQTLKVQAMCNEIVNEVVKLRTMLGKSVEIELKK